MAGFHLTTMSTIMCPHGGQALLITTQAQALADRALVLLETDIHTVVGCPFTVGQKYSPCVRIEWSAGATNVTVNGTATLTQTSIGQCFNAEGAVQGVATIVSTQQEASAR
jgi:hypothetical protein